MCHASWVCWGLLSCQAMFWLTIPLTGYLESLTQNLPRKKLLKSQSTGQVWVIGWHITLTGSNFSGTTSPEGKLLGNKGRYGFALARVVVGVPVSWVIGASDPITPSRWATFYVCVCACIQMHGHLMLRWLWWGQATADKNVPSGFCNREIRSQRVKTCYRFSLQPSGIN